MVSNFLVTGSVVEKLNSRNLPESVLLWVDHSLSELRWSKNTRSKHNYQKLQVSKINLVEQHFSNPLGFNVEYSQGNSNATLKFTVDNTQLRNKWVEELSKLTGDENNSTLTIRPARVLGDFNHTPESAPQTQVKDQLLSVLAQHGKKGDNPSVLLDQIMQENQEKIWSAKQNLQESQEHQNPKKLQNKINQLRKRFKMLELDEDQLTSQREHIQALKENLQREKDLNSTLMSKLEQLEKEKSLVEKEYLSYRKELEETTEHNSNLEKCIESLDSAKAETDVRVELAKKGFHGYVCTFSSAEIHDSINLTPRRPYEDGVYKKRLLCVSSDGSEITWRPISMFSQRKASLKIADITSVIDGTEDPRNLETFSNHKYITVVSKNITLILAINKGFSFYLEGLKELYARYNSLGHVQCELKPPELYQLGSDQLNNQLAIFHKLINRYKNSLIDSICQVDLGSEEAQSVYNKEIQALKLMNEHMVEGVVSPEVENYLRQESQAISQRMQAFYSLVNKLKK